jgi:hypothetical protein
MIHSSKERQKEPDFNTCAKPLWYSNTSYISTLNSSASHADSNVLYSRNVTNSTEKREFENIVVAQLVEKYQAFIELEGS